MEHGTLEKVLEVEKEIEKLLDSETASAHRWLERQKEEIEEARRSAIAELKVAVALDKKAAETDAEAKASRITAQARDLACRVDAMGEDRLNQIIWRHLSVIIPEPVRDH